MREREDRILLDGYTRRMIRENDLHGAGLAALAEFFGAMSDSNRIRIVSALALTEMCVNDISALLDINQTTVSHQLRLLRTAGIVEFRRQGKVSFYRIKTPAVVEVLTAAADAI